MWQGFGSVHLHYLRSIQGGRWTGLNSRVSNYTVWFEVRGSFIRILLSVLAPASIPMIAIYQGHCSSGNVFLTLWLFVWTQKESFTYWSAGALKCCHNMMYPGGTLQYEGHSWGGCRHPKSLFFNLCRSDGIDKLHYFFISHINIHSKYKRQQPLWPNSY